MMKYVTMDKGKGREMVDAIRIAASDKSGEVQEVVQIVLDNPDFDMLVFHYVKYFFRDYNLVKISKSEVGHPVD